MTSSTDGGDAYLMLRFVTAVIVAFSFVDAIPDNTLYVTNGTHILRINNRDTPNGATAVPVYSPTEEGGRIVGLAYTGTSGYLFWSDVNRWTTGGIYRAQTDSSGNLVNITRIVETDVIEINGLTADWVSNNIYWTDGRKRTIEVADVTGTHRRVLFYDNLIEPRGIYADPVDGWLYWNDQGTHTIERSHLDGSGREIYVQNTSLPNQMVVSGRGLYWVDSQDKTLRSKQLTAPIQLAPTTNNCHVFGLAISHNYAYVTSWSSTAQLLRVDLTSGVVTVAGTGFSQEQMFSAVFVDLSYHSTQHLDRPCSSKPCDQLCLPTGVTSAYRCACSSYGGKTLKNGNKCETPSNIVLFAMADRGFVGYFDPASASSDQKEIYLVGHSSRPVAVAYDPIKQVAYWSDVREQIIYSSKLDGSDSKLFLHRGDGVGVVDGMAVDYVGRQLYYSNIGSVTIDRKTYSWHKVETVNIDSYDLPKVKTIISSIADKPRAIAIDVDNAKLYYTDWGGKASVVKANLDGSDPVVIKTGLYNPNGLVLSGNYLYVADSNYKTRTLNLGTQLNGSVYRMSTDGSGWTDLIGGSDAVNLKTPFGLAFDGANVMYVSDWDTSEIREIKVNQVTATKQILKADFPMGLFYTAVSVERKTRPASCSTSTCGDICLSQTPNKTKCTCNSYSGKALSADNRTCALPAGYVLVSDMDGVKLVSLDSTGDQSVYVVAMGRPFDSNIVALAYDEKTNTIFYSDVASKKIYAHNITNGTSTEYYTINNVIDGMTVDQGILYWTDSEKGQILSRPINPNPIDRTPDIVISGLTRPRAIKVHKHGNKRYFYWTEWGANHRVARAPVDDRQPIEAYGTKLKWPNALFIYKNRTYIADGHRDGRKLVNCNLAFKACTGVESVTSDKVQHMYDIWIANDILYYTDWNTSSINALSLTTGIALQPIATGLMRPSQMYFLPSASTKGLSSTSCSQPSVNCTGPGSSCIQLLGNQQCHCEEESEESTALISSTTCENTQSLSCGSYPVGTTFNPPGKPCLSCQCLANRFYGNAEYNNATCETITCPPIFGCPNAKIPDGKCCLECPSCLRITDCPYEPKICILHANESRTDCRHTPAFEDCKSRDIGSPKWDINTLFGPGNVTVTVTVSISDEPTVTASCKYTVVVKDETKPTIKCPPSCVEYTNSNGTTVKWQPPSVFDNAGPPTVTVDYAWGKHLFPLGNTTVTYKATDSSENYAECTFNVTVKPSTETTMGNGSDEQRCGNWQP